MAMFQQYQNGVKPVTGMSEAGANIGNMYAQGITNAARSLTDGIKAYHENSAKWDMVSGEADALASQVSNTQKLFLSHPAYAPLAEALSPYVDQLSGVKSQSLPKALGTLNSVKAAYQGTMQQFPLYEAVRKEREYGAFGEGADDPNNTTKVTIVPVGTAPKELIWDYRKPVEQNMLEASKYYDKYKAANPSVRLQEKSEWVKSWLNNLPTQIANDTSVNKQVRDKAIELVNKTVSSNYGNFYDPMYWLEESGIAERSHPNFPTPAAINRMAGQPSTPIARLVANNPFKSADVEPPSVLNSPLSWSDDISDYTQAPAPVAPAPAYVPSPPVVRAPITPEIPVAPTEPRVSAPTPEYTGRAKAPAPAPQIVVVPQPSAETTAPARPAPTPAPVRTEIVTPPVPKVSTEPKVSAPTAKYSDKAQPAKTPERSVKDYAKELGIDEYYVKEQARAYGMSVPDFYNSIKRDAESNGVSPKEWLHSINTPAPADEPAPAESTTAPEGLPPPEVKFINPNSAEGQRARIQRKIEQGAYAGDDGNLKYNLQRGDTVVGLAKRFDMSTRKMEEYYKASGIDKNKSNVGDTIIFGPSTIEGQMSQEEAAGAMGDIGMGGIEYKPSAPLESTTYKPSAPLGSKEITPIGQAPIDPVKDEASRIASGMSTDDWAKVKVSRSALRSQNNDAHSGYVAYDKSLNWLRTMRDSVADGKSNLIDFGPYGQWEKLHPDAALTMQVGFDAATILFSGLKIDKLKTGAKALQGADQAANIATKAEKAFEVIQKARALKAEKLAKGPKQLEQMGGKVGEELLKRRKLAEAAEEAKLFEDALKKAGVEVNAEVKARIAQMGTDVYKQAGKGAFWTAVFEGMYGVNNEIPFQASAHDETYAYLSTTMDGVRKLRTGHMPIGPFGEGEGIFGLNEIIGTNTPLTGKEQLNIVKYLDEKIQEGQKEYGKYKTQYSSTFADLSDNKRLLSRYADISAGSPSANDVDTAYVPSAPLKSGSSIIGSKSFVTENTTEEKRGLLKNFMQQRLGYVPQGFDSMFNTQFPEATLKMQETPYGVMYHSNGEWKPMPSQKGNSMSFADVAKEKSVTFGEPQANGTFKPTEFIKGSGIRIGGIGSFGSSEAASKFRETYPKLITAKKIANELKALNEQFGRSFDTAKWGTAAAKVSQLIASMRVALIGVGSVSDFEQQLMKDLVQDPTAFFSLQSTTRAKYNAMLDNIEDQIQIMPQSFGLTVEMDSDKANDLQAARRAYQEAVGWSQLPESERAKIKASITK